MKIKPLSDRVLVKVEEVEEKTASGIFIPQTAQEKTQIATVIEIGDDEEITVKSGDKIMYDKYAGTTIKVDGSDHLLLRMSDILAIIE
jgi:chaperonin GroES